MKIVFFKDGNPVNSRIVNGFAKGFSRIGSQVQLLDLEKIEQSEPEPHEVISNLVQALRADYIFTASGSRGLLNPDGGLIAGLENINIVVYYPRDPRWTSPQTCDDGLDFLLGLENCRVFLWEKSVAGKLREISPERVDYLPLAVDDSIYGPWPDTPQASTEPGGNEIVFVGYPTRERLEILAALDGFNLVLYGPDDLWRDALAGRKIPGKFAGPVWDEDELCRIYRSAAINLNVTRETDKTCVNERVFSVLGSRGFIITDHRQDTLLFFQDGEDLVIYRDISELRDKLKYYLDKPDERAEIAMSGCQAVLDDHTYKNRAEVLQETLEGSD